MRNWSKYFQNPNYLEKSRMQIMSPDMKNLFAEYIGLKDGMKILDVGCGTGLFAYYLSETVSGCSFFGIDFDENLIEAAKAKASAEAAKAKASTNGSDTDSLRNRNSFCFTCGDALKLPYEDNSFDAVVSHTFLTSISDYRGAIREMQRVCKKDGVIAAVTCSDFGGTRKDSGRYPPEMEWASEYRRLQAKADIMYYKLSPSQIYINGIPENIVPRIFRQLGLTDVSVYTQSYFFSLSNAAMTDEDKRMYLELDYAAEKEKFLNLYSIDGAEKYLSPEECEAYLELLEIRRNSLIANIGENDIWEFMSNMNYLTVGKNAKSADKLQNQEAHEAETYESITEYENTKYKKCPPEETVSKIKSILENMGVNVSERYTDSGINSAHSLRLTIEGTNIGQNGKGTTNEYALASGYAEFMERLQIGHLIQNEVGFDFFSPDITELSEDEFLKNSSITTDSLKSILAADNPVFFMFIPDMKEELRKWDFAEKDGKYRAVPFKNIFTGHTEYLPEIIYRSVYFTNGSCAGNTREEALVQGLSEIMERHAEDEILLRKLTPPVIPEDQFEKYPSLRKLIGEFRQYPAITLRIMDASLGKGLPVIVISVFNRQSGKMLIRFGAHPRREVALERCLTEVLQGRNILSLQNSDEFDLIKGNNSAALSNRFNIIKAGKGSFPNELFSDSPSWKFEGLPDSPVIVEEQLDYMLSICTEHDWNVFVRNCCFTDFNAYHIVVPGISGVMNFGKARCMEKRMQNELAQLLRKPAVADENELQKLSDYLGIMQSRYMESSFSFVSQIPVEPEVFGVTLNAGLYRVFVLIALKQYEQAEKLLSVYVKDGNMITGVYVLWQLLKAHNSGMKMDVAGSTLSAVFDEEAVEEAMRAIDNPLDVLPELNCAGIRNRQIPQGCCDGCAFRTCCDMENVRTVAENVDRAFRSFFSPS